MTVASLAVVRHVEVRAQTTSASLRGRVVVLNNAGVASPIRRARVTLTSPTGAVITSDSDTEGRFLFEHLTPGLYRLDAVKPGFFVPANSERGVAVAATSVEIRALGAATRDIVVESAAAIEGRVVDASGQAVANMVVQVRVTGRPNAPLATGIQPVRTDDRGNYRLHSLPPGDYVIESAPLSRLAPAATARAASRASATYYPGVLRIEDAQSVSVKSTSVLAGIDITLAATTAQSGASIGPAGVAPVRSAARGTGRLAGKITGLDSSRPIEGARVTITREDGPVFESRGVFYTDAQGRFTVTELPSGRYIVRVAAPGFVDRTYGWTKASPIGSRIDLTDGAEFDRADVAMPRPRAVAGRVLDEFGDPAPGILVGLATTEFGVNSTRLVPVTSRIESQPTDDTGAFRIPDVSPGSYYVMALSGPFVAGSDRSGFALTLYPGTRLGMGATLVQVGSDADVLGVDFPLVPARTTEVRGTVVTPAGMPVPSATLALLPAPGGDVRIMLTRASATSAADGSFVFRNVPEGSYAIQAEVPSWARPNAAGVPADNVYGFTAVEVTAPTTTGVRVEARPPSTLRGRVIFEGPDPYPSGRDISIEQVPTDFISSPYETLAKGPEWTDDGAFVIRGLIGRAVIRASARPASWVMAHVTVGGKDVTDSPIEFGRGDIDAVEITFKKTGASVTGTVSDGDKPATAYDAILFSADPNRWAVPSRFVKLGRPNQAGAFRIAGLVPGLYLAIAVPQMPSGAWRDPELLRALAFKATPFNLADGETRSVTLKLVK